MAVDTYALTSLAVVKEHLNIPALTTTFDSILERMINSSSLKIENYINRKVKKRAYTEYQDGRSNKRTLLKQWPADKPTEVWVDSSSEFTDVTNKLAATDYDLDQDSEGLGLGIVLLNGLYFSKGTRNVKIVYEAGYATIPYDLADACIWTVEYFYDMRSDRRIGTSSKGKNNENINYYPDLPEVIKDQLDKYRRVEFPSANVAVGNL